MKVILTYHRISPLLDFGIGTIHPSAFRRHLALLSSLGIRSVTVPDLVASDSNDLVAITFDDGYSSTYEIAYDVMMEFGFKGSVLVIVGAVGRSNYWDFRIWSNRFKHMGWKEIEALAKSGFEIGSHTMTHNDLTRIPLNRLRWELEASKKTIEDKIGREVSLLAYPFGRCSRQVIEQASALGYRYGLLSRPSTCGERMKLGRFSVHSIDSIGSIKRILGLSKGRWLAVGKCTLVSWLSGGTGIVKRLFE